MTYTNIKDNVVLQADRDARAPTDPTRTRPAPRSKEAIVNLLYLMPLPLLVISLALPLGVVAQSTTAPGTPPPADPSSATAPCNPNNLNLVESKNAILGEVAEVFGKLGADPIPRTADNRQWQGANKFAFWLRDSREDVNRLVSYGRQILQMCESISTTGQGDAQREALHDMIASFSLNYLLVQQRLRQESQQFNTLSKIMKARLKAAQNAIDVIR